MTRVTAGRKRRPKTAEGKHLSKLTIAAVTTLVTAIIGGLVAYYLPKVLDRGPRDAILINVESDPEKISSFDAGEQTAALPASVSAARPADPAQPYCADFHRWAGSLGGVDVGSTRFRVTLQGNSDKAVVITQVRAEIIERAPATTGVYVRCPTAGDASIRSLRMDLDTARPVAGGTSPAAGPFGVTLARGETEIFDIEAATRTPGRLTTWVLLMSATINGKTTTLRVRNGGESFRTRGPAGTDATMFEWGERWSPHSPFI